MITYLAWNSYRAMFSAVSVTSRRILGCRFHDAAPQVWSLPLGPDSLVNVTNSYILVDGEALPVPVPLLGNVSGITSALYDAVARLGLPDAAEPERPE